MPTPIISTACICTSKATADPSGKIIAAPGTIEALQKYLELKPDGPFAQSAKELIAGLGGTVSTTFTQPQRAGEQEEEVSRSRQRGRRLEVHVLFHCRD